MSSLEDGIRIRDLLVLCIQNNTVPEDIKLTEKFRSFNRILPILGKECDYLMWIGKKMGDENPELINILEEIDK